MRDLDMIMSAAPVIPVLVIQRVEDAVPVAAALVRGGLRVIEVTMRTPVALEAIRAMKQVEGAIVGAGTVLNRSQLDEAIHAGSEFAVSPGLTDELGRGAADAAIPLLPGVASAGDIMRALDLGFTRLKFFPAMTSGGIPALKNFSSVFGDVRFCPTGGITQETAPGWLELPSVACVGGSWMVPSGTTDAPVIEEHARRAASLRRS